MTWDEITLESPSFHPTTPAGTMLRLPAARWAESVVDSAEATPQGNDRAPIKSDAGMYARSLNVSGQITEKNATSTEIWNTTVIDSALRPYLLSAWHFRDLLDKTRTAWWKEAASGNWHNDGTPARKRGLCRMRLGYKETGSYPAGVPTSTLSPYYVYGYVQSVVFGPVDAGMKTGLIIPYTVSFRYADVTSTGV